jgi:NADPH:quinone reductase-like Zn-dependent oxidoreductase
MSSSARRWVAEQFGAPADVLQLVDAEVAAPGPGEVTIEVRAAGMNPADYKHLARSDPDTFPRVIGYEVAGVISAIGPATEIASGGGRPGDEVLAFRVAGGWATALTVPAADVFAKPPSLSFPEAANLLLAGCTAAEMLHVTGAAEGETVLVHGASGAVGVSVLQQASARGIRVIGTAGEDSVDRVRRFGGVPVRYGAGLEERVREAAPGGVAAALDCVGTDEAVEVSLALVRDRARIVTIAAVGRAQAEGFVAIGGTMPSSKAFRDAVRADLVRAAGEGRLSVPVAATYPLVEAPDAVERLRTQHPGGKLALIP